MTEAVTFSFLWCASQALQALPEGAMSNVVDDSSGCHLILRTNVLRADVRTATP